MAVYRKSGPGELPEGAVLIAEKEAVTYQWKLINDWTPVKDVWPFKFGVGILGGSSVLSAVYINNHYRKKLKLHNFGKFSSFIPSVVLPVVMSSIFHTQFITNDIIIGKTLCPVCVELRAAGIQSLFSTVYPCIMAPFAAASFATRYYTYKVPSLLHNPKAALQLWMKFTRPIGNTLFGMCVLQAIVAMTVTYYEAKAHFKIQNELIRQEHEYEQQHRALY
ncbi:uncharacterized protein [Anabrus simplex]|uniref:uncharacterized protein n=1 Tax=Anabrus simplex TaxID=316456 RepID=UPI0034DD5F9B